MGENEETISIINNVQDSIEETRKSKKKWSKRGRKKYAKVQQHQNHIEKERPRCVRKSKKKGKHRQKRKKKKKKNLLVNLRLERRMFGEEKGGGKRKKRGKSKSAAISGSEKQGLKQIINRMRKKWHLGHSEASNDGDHGRRRRMTLERKAKKRPETINVGGVGNHGWRKKHGHLDRSEGRGVRNHDQQPRLTSEKKTSEWRLRDGNPSRRGSWFFMEKDEVKSGLNLRAINRSEVKEGERKKNPRLGRSEAFTWPSTSTMKALWQRMEAFTVAPSSEEEVWWHQLKALTWPTTSEVMMRWKLHFLQEGKKKKNVETIRFHVKWQKVGPLRKEMRRDVKTRAKIGNCKEMGPWVGKKIVFEDVWYFGLIIPKIGLAHFTTKFNIGEWDHGFIKGVIYGGVVEVVIKGLFYGGSVETHRLLKKEEREISETYGVLGLGWFRG